MNQSVELGVGLAQPVNFLDGVENGRVVLASKNAADFRQRRLRQILHEIHRNLARIGNLARI